MNLAAMMPKWTSWIPHSNSKEALQKPTATREVSDGAKCDLETSLSMLNAETNPGKAGEAEKRFLEICTEEQSQGHDIRPYWHEYRGYRNKKYH